MIPSRSASSSPASTAPASSWRGSSRCSSSTATPRSGSSRSSRWRADAALGGERALVRRQPREPEADPGDETDATGLETPVEPAPRPTGRRWSRLLRPVEQVSVAAPLDVPGQPRLDLDRALEALLFIADEPQSIVRLAAAVARPIAEVRAAIAACARTTTAAPRAAAHRCGGAGGGRRHPSRLRTARGRRRPAVLRARGVRRPDHRRVLAQTSTRLSQPALETLAVIAYKQPISRSSIASIGPSTSTRWCARSSARASSPRSTPTRRRAPSCTARPMCRGEPRHLVARRAAADLAAARRRPGGVRT